MGWAAVEAVPSRDPDEVYLVEHALAVCRVVAGVQDEVTATMVPPAHEDDFLFETGHVRMVWGV